MLLDRTANTAILITRRNHSRESIPCRPYRRAHRVPWKRGTRLSLLPVGGQAILYFGIVAAGVFYRTFETNPVCRRIIVIRTILVRIRLIAVLLSPISVFLCPVRWGTL